MADLRADSGSARTLRRAGPWVLSAFWLVQFVELTIVALIQGAAFAIHQLPERLVIVAGGMLLSLLLVEVAVRLEGRPFRVRLVGTLAAALAMCAILMVFAFEVAKLPVWGSRRLDIVSFVFVGFAWSWFFLSVAAAILALSYSAEVRTRGERMANLELVARDARLAALRYQINPHFLFNTLNSIAGLIRGQPAAETMVENLADFLRATLELDPVEDIPIEREVEFQRLYLAIEQTRFPHRLVAKIDLPPHLVTVPVPALITQPLVENSIRHAVAKSSGVVTISIGIAAENDWLVIRVEDDGGLRVAPAVPGSRTGIANVRERLAARYGTMQSVTATEIPDGGFRTVLRLPLKRPM